MPGKVGMLPMKSRNPRQHDDRGLIGNGAVEIAHAATIGAAACRRGDEYPRKAALNRRASTPYYMTRRAGFDWEGDFLAGCIVLTIRSSIARPLDTALPWTLVLSQEPDAPQSVIQAIY
jgi:hypothetical protein